LKCAGYLFSLNDQAARVEISTRLNVAILFGKHLIAGGSVDCPSSIQIRCLEAPGLSFQGCGRSSVPLDNFAKTHQGPPAQILEQRLESIWEQQPAFGQNPK
jgi:hypothetical protein